MATCGPSGEDRKVGAAASSSSSSFFSSAEVRDNLLDRVFNREDLRLLMVLAANDAIGYRPLEFQYL